MKQKLTDIKERVKKGCGSDEALRLLDEYIREHPQDDEALTERGMVHFGRGERALAINDYLEALRINPESNAKIALKAANDILDYYNKDLYNP